MKEEQCQESSRSADPPLASRWEHFVGRFTREETFKLIFDHVRNLGICALVAAAAYWKFNNIGPETVIAAFDRVIAGWLLALAVWLYFVNTAHLRKRMASAGADKMVIEFVGALHTYLALTIVISAMLARK